MPKIQTDVSDEALVTAIRANLCDFFRHYSRSVPEEHFENGKFTRWYSHLPHPWFSGVLSSQAPTAEDETFIEEVIRYFRAKKTRSFTWWMEPPLRLADWESALVKHGFRSSKDTPGMAADLNRLNESAPRVDGLEIRAVEDEASMSIWAEIFTNGYGLPADWSGMIFDSWFKLGLDFPIRNYLGYLNGEPVSTSTIFYGGGAAGIYDVATLPKARGKGIGAALTLHPLLEARAKGYRIGVLQSSEMGFKVYQALGFRHLCQIEYFHLSL